MEFTLILFVRVFSQAEENRQRECQAATRIQSWFRACKVRAYLRYDVYRERVCVSLIWICKPKKETFGTPSYAIGKKIIQALIFYTPIWGWLFPSGVEKHSGKTLKS